MPTRANAADAAICGAESSALQTVKAIVLSWMRRWGIKSLFRICQRPTTRRNQQRKAGAKVRFSMNEFCEKYYAQDGFRKRIISDMLTRKAFIKLKTSVEGGEWTPDEAGVLWDKWAADPSHPRDYDDRGQLQLKAKIKTRLEDFEEVGREKALERTERLGKKVGDKALTERFKCVVGQSGMEHNDFLEWGALRKELGTSMASLGSDGACDDEGLMAPQVMELVQGAESRANKPKALRTAEESESDEASGEDKGETKDDKEKPKGKDGKAKRWIDLERSINKAERDMQKQIRSLRTGLEKTHKEMTDLLGDLRACPSEKGQFVTEMALVDRRLQWLDVRLERH